MAIYGIVNGKGFLDLVDFFCNIEASQWGDCVHVLSENTVSVTCKWNIKFLVISKFLLLI